MILAFVGSVITGISSGALVAFFTGWISWLSVIRILAAGVYELYLTWNAGTDFHNVEPIDKEGSKPLHEYIGMNGIPASYDVGPGAVHEDYPTGGQYEEQQRHGLLDNTQHQPTTARSIIRKPPFRNIERNVNWTGWLGWIWSAIYMPISETIWVCVNLNSSTSGVQHLVRALAIGVSALGLTFDYKQRYGAALGQRWGAWAFLTFNMWNTGACLLLGVEALILLIHGTVKLERKPIPLLVAYPVFSVVWAVGSWIFLPPIDGERPWPPTKKGRVWVVLAGTLMGAFAGVFVAAPAFALWRNASFDEHAAASSGQSPDAGLELADYLACEGVSAWAKFAAVMP